MAQYEVILPIVGYALVLVEAESEKAAIDAALQSDDLTMSAIEEWEAVEHVVQGNVCYAPKRHAVAELVED